MQQGWIKICGLTREDAVAAALTAGVDAIGFVFAASPRQLTVQQAHTLARAARNQVRCVAVTRHPTPENLREIFGDFAPDVWQSDAGDLAAQTGLLTCTALPVYRSRAAVPVAQAARPSRLLFEGQVSGRGALSNWIDAAALAPQVELILAGGLNADNVAAAIRAVRPFGVDVSSGVESQPGIKSPQKIFEFVRAARTAFQELSS